jgi:hypothetical protein
MNPKYLRSNRPVTTMQDKCSQNCFYMNQGTKGVTCARYSKAVGNFGENARLKECLVEFPTSKENKVHKLF